MPPQSVEERLNALEKHAMWMAPQNGAKERKNTQNWWIASSVGVLASFGLFVWFAATNGVHTHFTTWGYKDEDGFVHVYNKRIKSEEMYILAISLGIVVAAVEKIVIKPGQEVLHHAMIQKGEFPIGTVFFYETSYVLLNMVTTFFYFTNVTILLFVLLGRVLGSAFVRWLFHTATNEKIKKGIGSLAF